MYWCLIMSKKTPNSPQIPLLSIQCCAELPVMQVIYCTLKADKIHSATLNSNAGCSPKE